MNKRMNQRMNESVTKVNNEKYKKKMSILLLLPSIEKYIFEMIYKYLVTEKEVADTKKIISHTFI